MNIDQDEYVAWGNEAAGVRIVVHDQSNMPYPDDLGILGKTGMLTSIHISRVCVLNNSLVVIYLLKKTFIHVWMSTIMHANKHKQLITTNHTK